MNIDKKTITGIAAIALAGAAIGCLLVSKKNKKNKLISYKNEHNPMEHNRHPNRLKRWYLHHHINRTN